jgi:class 3 adenylate cyclase/pimeloyl-ACP methyl ester carboxylesterase
MQGFCSHIDLGWDSPYLSSFLLGLSKVSRLILTDRRGWGCSDRFSVSDVPPFETMTDDLLSVLDAVGSTRAAIFATQECTMIASLAAATYPDRITGLILVDPYVTYLVTEDTPWMWTVQEWEEGFLEWRRTYPLPAWWEGGDHPERAWFDRYVRASVAPGALTAEIRHFLTTDIRPVLPAVAVPTLVVANPDGDHDTDPRNGRLIAQRIPGARMLEIPEGEGSLNWLHFYGRSEPILREVTSFLAGLQTTEAEFDRVLATVLFTDIVDSTRRAATVGDQAWTQIRETHDQVVRANLARFRGHEIKTMGDGFLATFDGPVRGVRCAEAIAAGVEPLGIQIRAGLHTGEVTLEGDDVSGLGVAIGARVGALGGPSEVLVTQTVKDLVAGSGLTFEDAGEHELKGVPDRWRLYRVVT